MACLKGILPPVSVADPQFGRVKKVFIAYAHNPDPYEQYIPPYPPEQLTNPDILQLVLQQKAEHMSRQQNKILTHKATIKRFADSLASNGVAVAYDQYFEGQQIPNILQNFEQQIRDSDTVLLIVTRSLKYYIDNDVPSQEEEILLTKHFLYNLMTVNKPDGTCFIPVFLNQPVNRSLVPITLSGAVCYSIIEPFDYRMGDMYDLYAFLTNQKTIDMSPPNAIIKLPPRKGPFGFTVQTRPEVASPHQSQLYAILCMDNLPLPQHLMLQLPSELASHWQELAPRLGLSPHDIRECIDKAGPNNDRESCYQMLLRWQEQYQHKATIAELAKALHDIHCMHLLYLLKRN